MIRCEGAATRNRNCYRGHDVRVGHKATSDNSRSYGRSSSLGDATAPRKGEGKEAHAAVRIAGFAWLARSCNAAPIPSKPRHTAGTHIAAAALPPM